ncbi:MAG TPA: UPF0280 family protein [Anaerohalosphaeraceae bacterium]|nr:UPF0280 family protein [Anaerohalosphaeraceae bacterium]HRT50707.1 UPF0280 family protein [Anaerohalosphaeraceae bacterium]HRT86941.1 UPF0280 family protein [Anaerohalosphaeraceae bacterium]
MAEKRVYHSFAHKDAVFRICCACFEQVCAEIVRQRAVLERYIAADGRFLTSFAPVPCESEAPEIARHMAWAGQLAGTGPMAAVAGAMAQRAAQAGLESGAEEAIVDNGGDIFLKIVRPATIRLYTGNTSLAGRLAFRFEPEDTPTAVCSSSSRMGHSVSLGDCDLATVVARDAALADAAATQAANLVKQESDIDKALEAIMAIAGIAGVLIVKNERVGLAGQLPPLVKVR